MKNFIKNFDFQLNFRSVAVIGIVIFISLALGLVVTIKSNLSLNEKIAQAEEAARPAELDIIIIKDSACQDCFDIQLVIDSFKEENIKINSEEILEFSSDRAKELIAKFKIAKVPTLLISGELEKETAFKELWPVIGEIIDNTFVLRQVSPPYILTTSGEIRGRIGLIMLTDSDCTECYDVRGHQTILQSRGLPVKDGEIFFRNSDEGKELISKYKIKLIPTIILTGDVDIYDSLKSIWDKVGTIEEDGAYVFRAGVKQMGTYLDLATNKVVKATAANPSSGGSSLKKIKVVGSEFSFSPDTITVAKDEKVELTFTNSGSLSHDFVIDELAVKTEVLSPGQSQTIQFTATKSGTFSFYCSVGSHRASGMEGEIGIR